MKADGSLLTRSRRRSDNGRQPIPSRWDLSAIIQDPVTHFDRYIDELKDLVAQLEARRARLAPSIPDQEFLEILQLNEEIANRSSMLGAYA